MSIASATTRQGLTLPASREAGGYFAAKSGRDLAWSNLILALTVPVGSRPMRRAFGSGLRTVLFNPQGQANVPIVNVLVRESARSWVPRVRIDRVTGEFDGRTTRVRIDFGVVGEATQSATSFMPSLPAVARGAI